MQLTALDTATTIEDMDTPGFRLHELKGQEKGRWSICVNINFVDKPALLTVNYNLGTTQLLQSEYPNLILPLRHKCKKPQKGLVGFDLVWM